ncbi:MAG: hypothetical protein WAK66_02385, partial [Methylocystis sp.]
GRKVALANEERRNNLRIRVHGDESPLIADAGLVVILRHLRLLLADVRPDFIALEALAADTDEAGHAFQFEVGHLYRSEAGHRSDLMSATGGLLPRIEVDDV